MSPELTQADLDSETLQQLLQDLGQLTEILEVSVKGGGTQRAQTSHRDLAELAVKLEAGELRGVQVRYLWQGQHWLDTLMRTPTGVRIIRTAFQGHNAEARAGLDTMGGSSGGR